MTGISGIKRALWVLSAVCLAAAAGFSGCNEASPREPVNVVIITLDTTRADHMGCYGSDGVKTPNLDAFAEKAVRFENCYSTTNSTVPSHTSIFTSLYMRDHGAYTNNNLLPELPGLLWNVLKKDGYHATAFTSGGSLDLVSNISQGLDEFYHARLLETPAAVTVNRVSSWLDKRAGGKEGEGLFLWVHFFDPHSIYLPPPPFDGIYTRSSDERIEFVKEWEGRGIQRYLDYFSRSQDPEYYRNMYKGEITYLDSELGRLFEALRSHGLYDSSIIVIVADHGESLGEHGIYWKHKGIYDDCTHVPLIVKPYGEFKPGVRDQLVSTLDIYPTVLDTVGAEPENFISGKSLMGVIGDPGTTGPHEELYFQSSIEQDIGVRTKDYTYIRRIVDHQPGVSPRKVLAKTDVSPSLFSNADDPGQVVNLYEKMPEKAEEFESKAAGFITDIRSDTETKVGSNKEHIEKLRALGYIQ